MLKRHYIALGLVAALTLVVLNLPDHVTARLKLAIGSLFLPLFGYASSAHQLSKTSGESLTPRTSLIKENNALRRENEQLRLHAEQFAEMARENARLRQLLDWQQKAPWKLKLARVVLWDPANWWRSIQINLGSRDGVRKDLPVLTSEGLVGRVSAVGLTRSQVILLGDPACKVAAFVENEARDSGILGTSGPFDGSLLTLQYLSKDAVLKPGQVVATSGLGGVFPRGIPIGRIVDSRQVEYGLYTEARVQLAANFGSLDEVWVLFPQP